MQSIVRIIAALLAMRRYRNHRAGPALAHLGTALALGVACVTPPAAAQAIGAADLHDAPSLLARYAELTPQLQKNQFQRPLVLQSTESAASLKGDIYAVLDYPFATVSTAFNGPDHWCDMLILHLNTKYCRAVSQNGKNQLQVNVGKKHDQALADAYRVNFNLAVAASTPDYLDVVLSARDGPMGTSDYRILLQAVALPNGRTFMHLTYSYAYGLAARIAMKAYLSTVGSEKVGFTRTPGGGDAQYIGGVRGVVERNTMRYYLAIDAYLSALGVAEPQQLERRLQTWFAATERYPRQLHEVSRDEYIEMKRSETQRQRAPQ